MKLSVFRTFTPGVFDYIVIYSCWFLKAPCNCKKVWNNEAAKDTFIEEYIDEHDVDEIQFPSEQQKFDQQEEAQYESTIENVFQDSKKFLVMKQNIMYSIV